jgi:hypothetical protein
VGEVNNGGGETACTKEAKICSDGTAVGRTGPNCEFAACPNKEPGGGDTISCTQDAKLCADGKTYVGRVAPGCQFAACPNEGGESVREEINTLKVGAGEPFNALYIVLKSVSDSRCATGNTCIWAGEAKAIFTWNDAPNGTEVEVKIGETVNIQGIRVTVEQIDPYPQAGKTLIQSDYLVRVRFQW